MTLSRLLLSGSRTVRSGLALLLALAFLAVSAPPVFAAGGQTGNLSGTVVDAQTKAPIAGATVNVVSPSGNYHAKTGSNGFFSILGLNVDSYTVSVEQGGYEAQSLSGITITGDQTANLGSIGLSKQLRTIARTSSRAPSGAYQPNQTSDSYTISGARITQTTGKAAATDENALLLAAPGVTLSNAGLATIRGGSAREVGYQYDGVTFSEPFLGGAGSSFGTSSPGNLFNGIGSLQVVEGAGDATQGNVGSGVINAIPKRGAYPGFGYLDFEMGSPNYNHQFGLEYGIATANNAISNYIAYTGQRFTPYYGNHALDAGPYLNYFGNSLQYNDQLVDNFVFRFGHNKNQSLQALYSNVSVTQYGNLGGIPGGVYDQNTNPGALAYYPYDYTSQATYIGLSGLTNAQYSRLIALGPGVPSEPVALSSYVSQPQINDTTQTRFLKFEYDNNLTASTFLALRYYNWEQQNIQDGYFSNGPISNGTAAYNDTGGSTVGSSIDLTQQLGSKLTVNLNAKYDNLHPLFDEVQPQFGFFNGFGGGPQSGASPSSLDWLPGGYVYNAFGGNVPRLPGWGIGYHGTYFQNFGYGARFQYNPISSLRFDLGVRYEGQNQHWINQLDQYGQGVPAGLPTYDTLPSGWTNKQLQPREWEPRAAVSYEINSNNSVRFSYGRSAVFINAQTGGTPFYYAGLQPYLNLPPKPGGFLCGSPSTTQFACKSYGEQLYWQGDGVEFPDAGNSLPALYSNYDFSFSHRFSSGWATRLTPFYKLGTDLPSSALIATLPGGNQIFGTANFGFNRTTGVELNVTTPDRPVGASGFFTATYQNVLSTTPPLSINETNTPLLSPATLALGDLYRAGYVSPFSFRVGGTLNTKSGFSVTPVLQYDIGYPYSIGNTIAGNLGGGQFANIPQVNYGAGVTPLNQIQNTNGTLLSTNYYDPAYPGNNLKPNIAFTRGTQAGPATGAFLSPANLQANLTLQYKKSGNTFGVQFTNLFGNAYINSVPGINPFYQPVATGLSGPQTGHNTCAAQYQATRGCADIPKDVYAYSNGAYLLTNGNFTGTTQLAPLLPNTIQVYYQRAL